MYNTIFEIYKASEEKLFYPCSSCAISIASGIESSIDFLRMFANDKLCRIVKNAAKSSQTFLLRRFITLLMICPSFSPVSCYSSPQYFSLFLINIKVSVGFQLTTHVHNM